MLSLPSRERGLKFLFSKILIIFLTVAPFAGAWIEIALKELKNLVNTVAPFAGAWIEIDEKVDRYDYSEVAPFAGAWIEMFTPSGMFINPSRRSLRGSVD